MGFYPRRVASRSPRGLKKEPVWGSSQAIIVLFRGHFKCRCQSFQENTLTLSQKNSIFDNIGSHLQKKIGTLCRGVKNFTSTPGSADSAAQLGVLGREKGEAAPNCEEPRCPVGTLLFLAQSRMANTPLHSFDLKFSIFLLIVFHLLSSSPSA